jgi:hypothetical protein
LECNLLALSSLVGSIITAGHDEGQSQQIQVLTNFKVLGKKDVSVDNKMFLLLSKSNSVQLLSCSSVYPPASVSTSHVLIHYQTTCCSCYSVLIEKKK